MAAFNDYTMPIWSNGPAPGAFYNFPGGSGQHFQSSSNKQQMGYVGKYGQQRSSQPITTGTSVVGLKYNEGVVIAADTLISYGSLARFDSVDRVFKVNNQIVIGAGGDFADFQYIKQFIDQKIVDDVALNDGHQMKPKSLYNWLMRILYNKRSRMNPLWLDVVVGGMEDGEPFLGHINLRGRAYQSDVIATGYGQHLAIPLLREYSEKPNANISETEARTMTKKIMEVLFYRDCRSFPKYTQAIVNKEGASVEGPLSVDQNWGLATMIHGY